MNRNQYNESIELYADNIYRFIVKHTQNKMLAEDIMQDTFTKVWEKHETVSVEKVKSYLFTTAYHQLIDTLKKEKRSTDIDTQDLKHEEGLSHLFDVQKTLNEAVNKLPEIQKTVVLLRDYEGYNYNEIAEITSLSESQVKVYIFRARQALKNYLKSAELVA